MIFSLAEGLDGYSKQRGILSTFNYWRVRRQDALSDNFCCATARDTDGAHGGLTGDPRYLMTMVEASRVSSSSGLHAFDDSDLVRITLASVGISQPQRSRRQFEVLSLSEHENLQD